MTRWDIINMFIYARHYKSFLEIGTLRGDTFVRVQAERKVSVDPDIHTNATHHMTSDEYFAGTDEKFDIIFIDGLHLCEQAYRDIMNGLAHLNPGGVIVMHDCHPTMERDQYPNPELAKLYVWTGDVWKAFVRARTELPYEMYVIDNDMGCGVIDTAYPNETDVSGLPSDMKTMTWHQFQNHPEWMNYR